MLHGGWTGYNDGHSICATCFYPNVYRVGMQQSKLDTTTERQHMRIPILTYSGKKEVFVERKENGSREKARKQKI